MSEFHNQSMLSTVNSQRILSILFSPLPTHLESLFFTSSSEALLAAVLSFYANVAEIGRDVLLQLLKLRIPYLAIRFLSHFIAVNHLFTDEDDSSSAPSTSSPSSLAVYSPAAYTQYTLAACDSCVTILASFSVLFDPEQLFLVFKSNELSFINDLSQSSIQPNTIQSQNTFLSRTPHQPMIDTLDMNNELAKYFTYYKSYYNPEQKPKKKRRKIQSSQLEAPGVISPPTTPLTSFLHTSASESSPASTDDSVASTSSSPSVSSQTAFFYSASISLHSFIHAISALRVSCFCCILPAFVLLFVPTRSKEQTITFLTDILTFFDNLISLPYLSRQSVPDTPALVCILLF